MDKEELSSSKLFFEKFSIGIIGYGRFGQLLHEIFKKTAKCSIMVYSRSKKESGNFFVSFKKLAENSDLVIPAVPIGVFGLVLKQLSEFNLKPGAIIMDVCSVKIYPVKMMEEKVPPQLDIIASHPMFGPVTYEKNGRRLFGLKMVMSNVRCDKKRYLKIKDYFSGLGLEIIEISPEEHDKLQARSQFVSQTIKWLFSDLAYKQTKMDTASAKALFDSLQMIGTSRGLYMDLLEYNPFAREELIKMIQKMNEFKEYL